MPAAAILAPAMGLPSRPSTRPERMSFCAIAPVAKLTAGRIANASPAMSTCLRRGDTMAAPIIPLPNMKLLYFNDWRLGVLKGENVVDVTSAVQNVPHTTPGNLIIGVIERWSDVRGPIERAASGGRGVPVSQVKIRPPLPKPVNVDCMAVNYMEDGTRKEAAPINAFHKSPGCIVGHGDTMVMPDVFMSIFEGEAELAVVIGKRAHNVPASHAMEHVFGYTNFIDGSAREVTSLGNSFYQMKSRDPFAPIGPYLVTADEIKDPHKLQVRLWVNGALKQNYNTDDMANKIPRCIEWISSIHDLETGDI